MSERFQGRVAIVTGGGSGIGAAVAKRLAADGAKMVVVFGRRLSALQKTVDAIGADHCYAMSVDVSDEEQVKSAIAKVHEMFGTVDILANMAGIPGPSERVEDYTFADFKKVYSINVFGTFLTMKYCLPIMQAQHRGAIVNTCSCSGMRGYQLEIGYGSSKFAVMGMTMNAANENGGNGVRINCYAPGWVDTDMLDSILSHGRARERVVRAWRQRGPQVLAYLGREAKLRHLRAAKQQLRAERHLLPGEVQRAHAGGRGVELPLFIKLAVVWQVCFRHQTQQLPMADDGGAVIELAVHSDRQTHERNEIKLRARLQHGGEPLGRGALERLLEKQVAARVAGQPQLGEHRQLRAIRRCALHGGDGLLRVERAVSHAQRGRDRAGFEKTVDHDIITLSKDRRRSNPCLRRRSESRRALPPRAPPLLRNLHSGKTPFLQS